MVGTAAAGIKRDAAHGVPGLAREMTLFNYVAQAKGLAGAASAGPAAEPPLSSPLRLGLVAVQLLLAQAGAGKKPTAPAGSAAAAEAADGSRPAHGQPHYIPTQAVSPLLEALEQVGSAGGQLYLLHALSTGRLPLHQLASKSGSTPTATYHPNTPMMWGWVLDTFHSSPLWEAVHGAKRPARFPCGDTAALRRRRGGAAAPAAADLPAQVSEGYSNALHALEALCCAPLCARARSERLCRLSPYAQAVVLDIYERLPGKQRELAEAVEVVKGKARLSAANKNALATFKNKLAAEGLEQEKHKYGKQAVRGKKPAPGAGAERA